VAGKLVSVLKWRFRWQESLFQFRNGISGGRKAHFQTATSPVDKGIGHLALFSVRSEPVFFLSDSNYCKGE